MKAEEIEVERLFKSGDQLIIPAWQRRYSWSESEWQALWGDLERLTDEQNSSHFIGSVVLHAQEWVGLPSEAHKYLVVDGQQRITTLTVLICAIRDRVALVQSEDHERDRVRKVYSSQLLRNSDLDAQYRPRLILQGADNSALERVVEGKPGGPSATLVEKAYWFFVERVMAMEQDAAERLLKRVLKSLSAVWVVLQPGDNAHRVFQTLNAGGKPLEPADLVRNYFFLLLNSDGDDFYAEHWLNLEKNLSGAELEAYLVAWAISQGYPGSRRALFDYFQKDLSGIESRRDRVLAYGKRLTSTAELYRFILHPDELPVSNATRRSWSTLARWGTVPAEGLLLYLLRLYQDGVVNDSQLREAAEIVISFMARRFLAGYAPNRHKSIFVRICHKLREQEPIKGDHVITALRVALSLGEDENVWPSDAYLLERVAGTPVYTPSRSRWTFLVLERINSSYFTYSQHQPEYLSDSVYTVEHVMPQRLSRSWEEDLARWGVTSPAQLHETHLHVLGNLTLSAINPVLSNRSLLEKLAMLKDDTLKLNLEITNKTSWDAGDIDERGKAMITRAIREFVSPMSRAEVDLLAISGELSVPAATRFEDYDDEVA